MYEGNDFTHKKVAEEPGTRTVDNGNRSAHGGLDEGPTVATVDIASVYDGDAIGTEV